MFLSNPELGRKEAYVPGLTQEFVAKRYGIPVGEVAKLGSAENPYGPSPKAARTRSRKERSTWRSRSA